MRNLDKKEIEQLKLKLETKKKKGIQKLRTAIYARKSAEDEKQTSLPTQIANCQDFISQYDFLEHTATYQEDNVSGMFIDGRLEYAKMMNAAERGEIDVIVVMKLDRLARSVGDANTTIKLLELYGCALLAGDDVSDSNTPVGEFMRNILLAQNQFHARRVASDVMAAECNNARKGVSAGSAPPYGLKTVKKHFLINEEEAPAVKIMFEMTAKGKSYQQIIDKLSSLGYTTRKGEKFSYSTLNSLLRNDKYYGTYIYNRVGSKRKKKRVLKEHFDEVRNEKAIPPIISKKLFDEVQSILDERKNKCRPKLNTSPYTLTGLVFCKTCGHSMSGVTNQGGRNNTVRRNYTCPNHHARKGKTCPTKNINAEYLETVVKDLLTAMINDYLSTTQSNVLFDGLKKELKEEIAILSKRITAMDKNANALLLKAAKTTDILSEKYESQAKDLLNGKAQLQAAMYEMTDRLHTLETIKICFEKQEKKLSPEEIFTSDEVTRELFRIYIKRIEIDDSNDDIEVIFNGE